MERNASFTDEGMNRSLSEANSEELFVFMPAIVFVSILMAIGVVGNTLTIYIYTRCFKPSNHKSFVLCLAALDLTSSLFSMPFHISMMLLPYMYYEVYACKLLEVVSYMVSFGSVLIITVIAIERYRVTSKPFDRKMSKAMAKTCCAICFSVAFLLSVPAGVIYGHSTVEIGVDNITGVQCFIDDDYIDTIYPLLFNLLPVLLAFICIVIISILYSFIIKMMFGSMHFRKSISESSFVTKRHKQLVQNSSQTNNPGNSDSCDVVYHNNREILHNTEEKYPDNNVSTNLSLDSETSGERHQNRFSTYRSRLSSFFKQNMALQPLETGECKNGHSKDKSEIICHVVEQTDKDHMEQTLTVSAVSCDNTIRRTKRTRQTTVILLTITIVFVISFIPHIGLMITAALNTNFLPSLSNTELSIFQFFRRSFFVNNMANPIIYGLCDSRFRKGLKNIFKPSLSSE